MSSKTARKTDNTVFVRFTPPSLTRFHLEEHFSNVGPIKKCSVIRNNNDENNTKGYGFVKFVSQTDAESAAKIHNNSSFKNENGVSVRIFCELASNSSKQNRVENKNKPEPPKEAEKQKQKQQQHQEAEQRIEPPSEEEQQLLMSKRKRHNRVIVRNLNFHANEQQLRSILEKEFGPIVEITIPKIGTTHRGFGFVTFEHPHHAQSAVDRGATDKQPVMVKNRPVAIDFSVPKMLHQRMKVEKREQKQKQQQKQNDEGKEETKEVVNNTSDDSDSDGDSDSDSDSDGDGDGDDAESAMDSQDEKHSENSDDSDSDSDGGSGSDSDSGSKVDEPVADASDRKAKETVPTNPEDCTTLFMRNLPFDATRHDVFQIFSRFGHIASAYLVKDRETGVAKGTAFVSFGSEKSAQKALEAAGSANDGDFVTQKEVEGNANGLYLSGRRLLVDLAVSKATAATLTAEKQESKSAGKDRRNLYLKAEGRVANLADGLGNKNNNAAAWENLSESDQLKRQRAFAEKHTKLRSPLFFINPYRLSIRNLAKTVDEAAMKKMCVAAIVRGLEHKLVVQEDQVAHWRAAGEMTSRDIMQRIKEGDDTGNGASKGIIPSFDEKNIRQFIPSLYIDRDFTTNQKEKAPSRGFGFVEFQHHAHALVCLREMNNNPFYSADYAAGGKKATEAKKNFKQHQRNRGNGGEPKKGEFIGEDGKVKIPRLIVEFTVENKAKARKQAEHKAQQQANVVKQKLENKAKKETKANNGTTDQKKSRGQKQRDRKRKQLESGDNVTTAAVVVAKSKESKNVEEPRSNKEQLEGAPNKLKTQKPPKKQRKVDKEEVDFETMVKKYTAAFEGPAGVSETTQPANIKSGAKKRWYD